ALLGAGIHVHVGRSAPLALHFAARLDTGTGHGVLADPAGTVVGRHDQRHHDPVRRMAQASHRPDPQVPGHGTVVLRHGHVRGFDDVHPYGERAVALHRLDCRPRTRWRAWLGGHDHLWFAVLHDSSTVRSHLHGQ